jgi:hypothetical protein
MILSWNAPDYDQSGKRPVRYAVYRLHGSSGHYRRIAGLTDAVSNPDPGRSDRLSGYFQQAMQPRNLVEITGRRQFADPWPEHRSEAIYLVTSVSRNSVESEPAMIRVHRDGVKITGIFTADDNNSDLQGTFRFHDASDFHDFSGFSKHKRIH